MGQNEQHQQVKAEAVLVGGWKGLSGSTLKLIAIVTMLIDHTAAVLVASLIRSQRLNSPEIYDIYTIMRDIGRIAFPIFCFFIVEGFHYTRNAWKYAARLALFALISEIPFDLALNNRFLEFSYQNVFFTLLVGLLTIQCISLLRKKMGTTALSWIVVCAVALVGMLAADLLRTDYGSRGVLCIVVFYAFRSSRLWQVVFGNIAYVLLLQEPFAALAFAPIAAYNGKRGWKLKYLFYFFYPVHLLILYLICLFMGLR
jgi:hypothetical protein